MSIAPHVPIMLFYADYVPVLLADSVQKVVAVCHAGWKGTVAKIAQKTLQAMQEYFAQSQLIVLLVLDRQSGQSAMR